MPNPTPPQSKPERLARFICRFLSKRTSGSSLVVQTGFPTSLADLVVKNRAKFKKRKKPSPSPSPSHSSDLDSAPSVAALSESDGSGDRRAPADESPDRIDGAIEAASVPMRRRGGGLGLWFLVVKVAALVVLAVGKKWVVAGITVFTFGLLVLELAGLLRLRSRGMNVIDERFDLGGRGLVSPIREADDRQNSDCLDSNSEILLERSDFDANLLWPRSNESNDSTGRELVSPLREIESEYHRNSPRLQSEGSGNSDLGIARKSRRKKLFRKLFKRKNREKKDEKESSSSALDGSRASIEAVPTEAEEEGGSGDDIEDISDDEFISFQDDNHDTEVIEIDSEDVNEIRDHEGEIRLGRWRKLVFIVVVLLGLLGGKGLALVLTVVLYLLSGCTGTVWKKGKMRRID